MLILLLLLLPVVLLLRCDHAPPAEWGEDPWPCLDCPRLRWPDDASLTECEVTGWCIGEVYRTVAEEHADYVALGVCSGCKAISPQEAGEVCRPEQSPCGEWECPGADLWEGWDD